MKLLRIDHKLVEYIPEELEEGILYISEKYRIAAHKCCCGCGEEVFAPLNPTDWSLRINDRGVTMHPSIGNWSYSCQSHYIIRNSRIVWAGPMSQDRIKHGREVDRAIKKTYFEELNLKKNKQFSDKEPLIDYSQVLLVKVWLAFKRWFKS